MDMPVMWLSNTFSYISDVFQHQREEINESCALVLLDEGFKVQIPSTGFGDYTDLLWWK